MIWGEQPSRRGSKQLKGAFFLSAFAMPTDPASRAYYDKKVRQGKHQTQALLGLARRRADVLFAMLRDDTFHEPPTHCHRLTKRTGASSPALNSKTCRRTIVPQVPRDPLKGLNALASQQTRLRPSTNIDAVPPDEAATLRTGQ